MRIVSDKRIIATKAGPDGNKVIGRPLIVVAALAVVPWMVSAETDGDRTVIRVGPELALTRPSQAAVIAPDGAVIEIQAGNYFGDVAVWRQNGLVVRGVGGRPHVRPIGRAIEQRAIWVFTGDDVTVENVELSRARTPDRRGAALYHSGAGLTVRGVYIHDNEAGLVTSDNPTSDVVVERSVFAWNGGGSDTNHSLDVGRVLSLTLRYSHLFGGRGGVYVRSRARRNRILYNRIADEALGISRAIVDLPDGGPGFLIGNLLHKGRKGFDAVMIDYGREAARAGDWLHVVNNTFVGDRPGVRFMVAANRAAIRAVNNIFSGTGKPLTGGGRLLNSLVAPDPGFVEKASYNYRLAAGSPAIDAGVDPGEADGMSLDPVSEYLHPADALPRSRYGVIDIGAYEWSDRNPRLLALEPNLWVELPVLAGKSPARRAHAGAVYDRRRGTILVFGADTHFHDFNNSVYEFDPLYQTWRTHYESAIPTSYRVDGKGRPVAGRNRLLPWAMHVYDNIVYDPTLDALVVTSAPKHNSIRGADRARNPTWIYGIANRRWRILENRGAASPVFFAAGSTYDSARDVIVAYNALKIDGPIAIGGEGLPKRGGLWELGPDRREWKLADPGSRHSYGINVGYDAKHGKVVVFGDTPPTSRLSIYTPGRQAGAQGRWETREPGGDRVPPFRNSPVAFDPGNGVFLLVVDDETGGLSRTYLYDYATNRYTRLPRAELPKQGMNFMMVYDTRHEVFLLVTGKYAKGMGKTPIQIWALKLDPAQLDRPSPR